MVNKQIIQRFFHGIITIFFDFTDPVPTKRQKQSVSANKQTESVPSTSKCANLASPSELAEQVGTSSGTLALCPVLVPATVPTIPSIAHQVELEILKRELQQYKDKENYCREHYSVKFLSSDAIRMETGLPNKKIFDIVVGYNKNNNNSTIFIPR